MGEERRGIDMTVWFCSDPHFDHANILRYCQRPFSDVREMNKAIIRNINDVVEDNDTLYVLGDLGFFHMNDLATLRRFTQALNGNKILIVGNHDRLPAHEYEEAGFKSVHTSLTAEGYYMAHDPAWSITQPNGTKCLCGHVHTLFKKVGNIINVGVDVWDYGPVSKDTIDNMFKELEQKKVGE